jgi:hypothetical protein
MRGGRLPMEEPMAVNGPPPGWEAPRPGETWTLSGGAPPPMPTAPPVAPPAYGPPGYGPPGYSPPGQAFSAQPPTEVVRKGGALGPLSIVTTVGIILASGASALLASAYRQRGQEVADAKGSSLTTLLGLVDRFEELDASVAGAAALTGLFTIITGIAWAVWQRRFVRNASAFAPIAPSVGWGSWGWFVPFANLYMPQSQLANAARVTDPIRVRSAHSGAAPAILYCWWVLFSGSTIAQVGSNFTRPAPIDPSLASTTFDAFAQADQWAAISSGLSAVAGLFGAATVLVCTARQRAMLGALGVEV